MKKILIGFSSFALVLTSLFIAIPAAFASGQNTSSAYSCHTTSKPLINVSEKIVDDVDSGLAGNYWAYDALNRTIKVWLISGNTYCAVISDNATFKAIAGQRSPGNTAYLTGDEHGNFYGGYLTTNFTGTLYLSDPAKWPLKGKINYGYAVDYECDVAGNCPGYISWVTQYFTNVQGYDLAQWGWTYIAADHDGKWVNAITGTFGDIYDRDSH